MIFGHSDFLKCRGEGEQSPPNQGMAWAGELNSSGHLPVTPGGWPGPVLVCDTPQPPPPPPGVLKDSGAGAMAQKAPNFLSHA